MCATIYLYIYMLLMPLQNSPNTLRSNFSSGTDMFVSSTWFQYVSQILKTRGAPWIMPFCPLNVSSSKTRERDESLLPNKHLCFQHLCFLGDHVPLMFTQCSLGNVKIFFLSLFLKCWSVRNVRTVINASLASPLIFVHLIDLESPSYWI